MDWHPLRFRPIYKERVWGGRSLARLYARELPGSAPIGESWEISDRPGDISVVSQGPLAGQDLHQLLEHDAAGLLGDAAPRRGRFPLLIKILDARQALSLQVHPPAAIAARLGGEAKSEMWYVTDADPGAEVLAGLRPGTTRADFERRIRDGSVADCFHRIPARSGDALFLPSGRVHALGAGLVLFEIQENSDTTYRVFDWNRVGLDGKPRELHLPQSLESIDFQDFSPGFTATPWTTTPDGDQRTLADNPLFRAWARRSRAGARWSLPLPRCIVIGMVRGEMVLQGNHALPNPVLRPGDFVLLPAALGEAVLESATDSECILSEPSPA